MGNPITSTEQDARVPQAGKRRLTPTLRDRLAERSDDLPVWVRAPRFGVERYTGLSRAKLCELASTGKIKTASLREPGRIRGCRLFLLSFILGFIESNQLDPIRKLEEVST